MSNESRSPGPLGKCNNYTYKNIFEIIFSCDRKKITQLTFTFTMDHLKENLYFFCIAPSLHKRVDSKTFWSKYRGGTKHTSCEDTTTRKFKFKCKNRPVTQSVWAINTPPNTASRLRRHREGFIILKESYWLTRISWNVSSHELFVSDRSISQTWLSNL